MTDQPSITALPCMTNLARGVTPANQGTEELLEHTLGGSAGASCISASAGPTDGAMETELWVGPENVVAPEVVVI